ncbi:hypothetical protein [Peribacillus butanolivorans]|uniref:hypothetical protein n=1 Tax=Peribacillus butanolivorans TaxID=421767 RepID=UPI003672BEAE
MRWLPIALFAYSLAKILQNNPLVNIPFQTFEMKICSLISLKLIIFLKIIASTLFIVVVLILLKAPFTPILVVALITNSLVNYIGFIKYQISTLKLYIVLIISLLVILFSFQVSNSLLSIILFLAMLAHLIGIKSFKYDYLYPYYRIMSTMFQGLINQDFSQISTAQNELLKNNKVSKHRLMENNYNSMFFIAKEITRFLFNIKGLLNVCIFTFIIGFISYYYVETKSLHIILLFIDLILIETILSKLNKSEHTTITTGFYLQINLVTIIKQKWLTQGFVVLLPLVTGFLIFEHVSAWILVIVVPLIPIRNIIFNFTNKKLVKIAMYLFGAIIYGSFYIFH